MELEAIATEQGVPMLMEHIKENVQTFILIGDADNKNTVLDELVKNPKTTYDSIKPYILDNGNISYAGYDENSILTFSFPIDYEDDLDAYLYGIGLLGEKNGEKVLISISSTPKIFKFSGVGGTIVYKIDLTGEAGKLIFNNSAYEFATMDECVAGIIDYKAVTPAGTHAAIYNMRATLAECEAGLTDDKIVTPAGMYAAVNGLKAVGEVFPLYPNSPAPDNSGQYKYIELTFGLTGVGQYNEGLLHKESLVTDTTATVFSNSTAVVCYSPSPFYGQTIRMLNTERRYLRAGKSGTLYNDAIRNITGYFRSFDRAQQWVGGVFYNESRWSSSVASGGGDTWGTNVRFDLNGRLPIANENRVRTMEMKYYMRIA